MYKAVKCFENTRFVLADPSEAMLCIAKEKFSGCDKLKVEYLLAGTHDINCLQGSFDVITAIQAHHYLDTETRKKATVNCFRMLKDDGIYITFEISRPNTEKAIQIGLKQWQQFQLKQGKSIEDVKGHIKRFGVEYFPISIERHISLLHEVGFSTVEILWTSRMQAGFYAIK